MTKQELIDEVMDNFDFNKVAKAMKALNWIWAFDAGYEVPEEGTIRKLARELLNDVIERAVRAERDYTVGTGGFEATYTLDYKMLSLKFIVSSWETDGGF